MKLQTWVETRSFGSAPQRMAGSYFTSIGARVLDLLARTPPDKALQMTPESLAVPTCGIVLAAGAAVPAPPVSTFWFS